MKSKKKSIILTIVLLVLIGFVTFFSIKLYASINTATTSNEEEIVDEYLVLKNIYLKNKEKNKDYMGQIYFESGLFDLPFVQGETNDTYLRTNWETGEYDIMGSVFLDSANDIYNDQNIIIYGHNLEPQYDSSLSQMFTPLRVLMDENNYSDNNIINLFVGDKILKYEVVSIFRVKISVENGVHYIADGEPIYVLINYSSDEFNEYISKVKEREYYDSGVTLEETDRLLTLQTCVDNSDDKLVVLCKLIEEIDVE